MRWPFRIPRDCRVCGKPLRWGHKCRAHRHQGTFVYCPGCQLDLCTSEGTTVTDTDLVRYVCGKCGTPSTWDFDLFPVPVLIEEDTRADS